MGRQAWSVRLADRDHGVDVEHGYWFGGVTVRLDGAVVIKARPLLDMATDRGVDLPLQVEGHELIVAIRPIFWLGALLVSGYVYALTVDGQPAPGSAELPPLVRRKRRGIRSLNAFIEAIAWTAGTVAFVRLFVDGPAVMAPVILGAPALSSLVLRRGNQLPCWIRLSLAAGAFVAWMAVSATVARGLRLVPG